LAQLTVTAVRLIVAAVSEAPNVSLQETLAVGLIKAVPDTVIVSWWVVYGGSPEKSIQDDNPPLRAR